MKGGRVEDFVIGFDDYVHKKPVESTSTPLVEGKELRVWGRARSNQKGQGEGENGGDRVVKICGVAH